MKILQLAMEIVEHEYVQWRLQQISRWAGGDDGTGVEILPVPARGGEPYSARGRPEEGATDREAAVRGRQAGGECRRRGGASVLRHLRRERRRECVFVCVSVNGVRMWKYENKVDFLKYPYAIFIN